jgi:hypothetical protein
VDRQGAEEERGALGDRVGGSDGRDLRNSSEARRVVAGRRQVCRTTDRDDGRRDDGGAGLPGRLRRLRRGIGRYELGETLGGDAGEGGVERRVHDLAGGLLEARKGRQGSRTGAFQRFA